MYVNFFLVNFMKLILFRYCGGGGGGDRVKEKKLQINIFYECRLKFFLESINKQNLVRYERNDVL